MENLIDWIRIDSRKDAEAVTAVIFAKVPAENDEYLLTEAARTVLAEILIQLVKDGKGNDLGLKKTIWLSPTKIFELLPAESEAANYSRGKNNQAAAIVHTIIGRFALIIFEEIKSGADVNAMAVAQMPAPRDEDRFWNIAAQDVLKGVLAYCDQTERRTNADLWQALSAPIPKMAEMCLATSTGRAGYRYILDAGSKQAAGVIAVLKSYLFWLEIKKELAS